MLAWSYFRINEEETEAYKSFRITISPFVVGIGEFQWQQHPGTLKGYLHESCLCNEQVD